MKPMIVSWNVLSLNENEKKSGGLEVFLEIGMQISFVYKRQKWSIFLGR
jgi:hypothetical protein